MVTQIIHPTTVLTETDPPQEPVEAVFVDADGNPIDITGGGSDAPTTIPQGALVPGAGINLVRDQDSGVITASVKDKGVTAGMIADGVIPVAATAAAAGVVKQATYVADPAGDTVAKAEFVKLRDALVAAGIMAPKA